MTYNVFGGTLSLTQSINQSIKSCLLPTFDINPFYLVSCNCRRVVYCVSDNHLWLVTQHTDTVDGWFVIATAPSVDRSGWTTSAAMAQKQASHSVDTTAGAVTTVDTIRTSLSRATPVLLQSVCSSKHCMSLQPQSENRCLDYIAD